MKALHERLPAASELQYLKKRLPTPKG